MADRVAQGFLARMAETAPHVSIDVRRALPDMDAAAAVYDEFQQSKSAVVFLRSTGAQYMGQRPPSIPGFFGAANHPVALGAVSSMARPDRNLTGVTYYLPAARHLAVFRQVFPNLRRIALLVENDHPSAAIDVAETQTACDDAGIDLIVAAVATTDELSRAAAKFAEDADLLVLGNQALVFDSAELAATAFAGKPVASLSSQPALLHVAAVGLAVDDVKLGTMLAESVLDVLVRGIPISRVPVKTDPHPRLVVNSERLAALGLSVPTELLRSELMLAGILRSAPTGIGIYEAVGQRLYAQIADTGFGMAEGKMRAKDGTPLDVIVSASPLNAADPAAGVIFTLLDVTGRKKAEAALASRNVHFVAALAAFVLLLLALVARLLPILRRQKHAEDALRASERKLNDILDNVEACVYIKDLDGRYAYANRKICELWRTPIDKLLGLGDEHFFDPATTAAIRKNDWRVLVDGETIQTEETNTLSETGQTAVYWSTKLPLREPDGRIRALLGISTDITQSKATETALRETNALLEATVARASQMAMRAQAASRAKSEFLANVSHEIRTPMNAIIGFADLLSGEIENPSQRRQAATIAKSAQSLLRLINDILDLSKIEAGKLDVRPEPFSPAHLLDELRLFFEPRARDKGLRLEFAAPADLPPSLLSDSSRLRQILVNLLGNAVKFTDSGHVRLSVRAQPSPDSPGAFDLRFDVLDTGPGIPDDFKPHLFGAFEQRPGQDHAKYGGTGLGLAIARRLAELMDGSISVADNPDGQGTLFSLALPRVPAARAPIPIRSDDFASRIAFSGSPSILLVDDVPESRELLKNYLAPHRFRLVEATNGQEAIERLAASTPDLILADLKMPVMDGRDLALHLKSNRPSNPPIPLLVLTAAADELDALRGEFDGCLLKPIRKNDLLRELARFLPHSLRPAAASPAPAANAPPLPADLAEEVAAAALTVRISQVRDLADKLAAIPERASAAENLRAAANAFQIDVVKSILQNLQSPP